MIRKTIIELEQDLKKISAGKVLDLATGRGEFINMLTNSLKDFESITGIDTHEKALKTAKNHFKDKNIKFVKMDAYDITFPNESFDTVSLSNSLHHFSNVEDILKNMKRVLKKKGHLIINEMHCNKEQTEEQKTHILLHHWWGEIDSRMGIVHNSTYTSRQIEDLVSLLELKEITIYEYSFPIKDPKDEKMIDTYISYFDPYVDRIKDHKDYKKLKDTGEKLKLRLKKIGFSPATSLFIIGKK